MSLTDIDLLCYRDLAVSQTLWPSLKRCMDGYLRRPTFSDLKSGSGRKKAVYQLASRLGNAAGTRTQGLSITRNAGDLPVLTTS